MKHTVRWKKQHNPSNHTGMKHQVNKGTQIRNSHKKQFKELHEVLRVKDNDIGTLNLTEKCYYKAKDSKLGRLNLCGEKFSDISRSKRQTDARTIPRCCSNKWFTREPNTKGDKYNRNFKKKATYRDTRKRRLPSFILNKPENILCPLVELPT